MLEFLGGDLGEPSLQRRFPQIFLLDKVERDRDEGQEEQHNGRPAQQSAAAVQRRIRVEGRGVS